MDEKMTMALLEKAAVLYREINHEREQLDEKLREWDELLLRAREAGMQYTEMGRFLGTSEAAMRVAVRRARVARGTHESRELQ